MDLSPTRLHSLALHFRHRSSSLESQGKLLGSENDTGSPDFYTPRTRSSNGSDPMDDCSSCTSHSSSEHYYPAQMNANYSTLAEDSPSKARARQRQRQRAAGALGAANSGSMPNLAARGGGGAPGVYLHSQSQPSSQYRIKEYPLYIEGGATPVVVRSLESDQEGHYSVKAQFKTSNSYTAGGLFRESWRAGDEGDAGRLTPSRSQILRTPSLGREGAHDKGAGRAAVSDELRQWYQRSAASHKEHSRLSHTSSTSSDSGSQYSTSSQSTFVAHSRVTRMPQMCKATSGEGEPRGGALHGRAAPRPPVDASPRLPGFLRVCGEEQEAVDSRNLASDVRNLRFSTPSPTLPSSILSGVSPSNRDPGGGGTGHLTPSSGPGQLVPVSAPPVGVPATFLPVRTEVRELWASRVSGFTQQRRPFTTAKSAPNKVETWVTPLEECWLRAPSVAPGDAV